MIPCLFIRRLGVGMPVEPANSMAGILNNVAERHGFLARDLKRWSVAYAKDPVERVRGAARDEAMWLMWHVPDPQNVRTGRRYSLPQIGRFMGCHHTTPLEACRRHEARSAMRMAAE